MLVTNGENISTTYDLWYDIEKIEYYNDGDVVVINYKEKDEKSS